MLSANTSVHYVEPKASATFRGTGFQTVAADDNFGFTVAAADPARSALFHVRETHNDEATESLSGDINESGHGDLLNWLPGQVAAGRLSPSGCRVKG